MTTFYEHNIENMILSAFSKVFKERPLNTQGCALLEQDLEQRLGKVVKYVHVSNATNANFGEKGYIVCINGCEFYLGTNVHGSYVKLADAHNLSANDYVIPTPAENQ